MASVQSAAARAVKDPGRPIFHVMPPANWCNDPNGPIYYKGYFHLFYQHNPFDDRWEHMHWGHVRSKDLVHWEHQPIALWPSQDKGENHVFSGCAAVNDSGQVMLIYTSIGNRLPAQWAAVPADENLITWTKHPKNPILTEKLHGRQKVYEWRDPFLFQHRHKTYLVAGGNLNNNQGGQAVVNVYEALDGGLTEWKYLGILFRHPDSAVRNIECPNFFPLGSKWVLIVSQGQPVQYFVGSLDDKTMTFKPEKSGVLDYGSCYAPNSMEDPQGRRILWGWVNGFQPGKGWNGCLTLPRILTLGPDLQLSQGPAPEIFTGLRGKSVAANAYEGNTFELVADFDLSRPRPCGLRLLPTEEPKSSITIEHRNGVLTAGNIKSPLNLTPEEKKLTLRVFVDRSVVEIYVNDRVCITVVRPHGDKNLRIDPIGNWQSSTAWELGSIWRIKSE
jgi:beta-fructofuranosidase